jgi:hypothetical protein
VQESEVAKFYILLAECGDNMFDYASALVESGLSAFMPRSEFHRSFCRDAAEQETHRSCSIELAKVALARPLPARPSLTHDSLYRSTLIEELVRVRDHENGYPGSELRTRAGRELWRMEIDPCRRQLARSRLEDRPGFDLSWSSVRDKELAMLISETTRHSSGLSRRFSFGRSDRWKFYVAAMEQVAGPLGFCLDKQRSSVGAPVLTKDLAETFRLSWHIDPARFALNNLEGDFRPSLELRAVAAEHGVGGNDPQRFLFISYDAAVRDFAQAYCTFRSLDQLETIIKAHLMVYRLLAPSILEAVHGAFSKPQ